MIFFIMRTKTTKLLLILAIVASAWACLPGGQKNDAATFMEIPNFTLINEEDCLRDANSSDRDICLPNPLGCSRIDISVDSQQTCEACFDDAGDLISESCGTSEIADCSRLENNYGDTCTICRAPSGTVYVDTCNTPDATRIDSRCEAYTSANGTACEICYDDNGGVVRRECYDESWDYCVNDVDSGADCRRCYTANDILVFEDCQRQPSSPTSCSGFTSEQGISCYTCQDVDGNVVDHNCASTEQARCQSYYSSNGVYCTVCYDRNGAVSSHQCEDRPINETCRTYDSEGSICTICTDQDGNVTRRECDNPCASQGIRCATDDDCSVGSSCVGGMCSCLTEPSACELISLADGTLCEICGDINGDGFVDMEDANCFPIPQDPVTCWEEWRNDTSDMPQLCTICQSDTGGITEDCGGSYIACTVEYLDDNNMCEICRDRSGALVHSSCDALICEQREVVSVLEPQTSVSCEVCSLEGSFEQLLCDSGNICTVSMQPGADVDGGELVAPSLSDPCGNVWVKREPLACGNPWEAWWLENNVSDIGVTIDPVNEGEIIRAYYMADQHQAVSILAYRINQAFEGASCAGCNCARGDVIWLYASENDGFRLMDLGWQLDY